MVIIEVLDSMLHRVPTVQQIWAFTKRAIFEEKQICENCSFIVLLFMNNFQYKWETTRLHLPQVNTSIKGLSLQT